MFILSSIYNNCYTNTTYNIERESINNVFIWSKGNKSCKKNSGHEEAIFIQKLVMSNLFSFVLF